MLNSFIKSFWTLETGIQHAERYWPKIVMDSIPDSYKEKMQHLLSYKCGTVSRHSDEDWLPNPAWKQRCLEFMLRALTIFKRGAKLELCHTEN